ncbi:MAG TPA: PAS domain-containing protein, partial [Burkholderiales bacterium]|nr:PAS domain-containing protein [Burkholderiales bacterium]
VGSADGERNSESSEKKQLLFDSDQLTKGSPARSAIDPSSTFVYSLPVEIASRIWEFQYSAPKDAAIGRLDSLWPSGVLAGGLLSSFLLFGVLYSLSLSRGRALKLAAQMTKDLRETEERFRLIAESASDLIVLIDPQGRRIYANPAYGRLFGDYQGLEGTDAFQEIHPEDKRRVQKAFFDTVHDGENRHVEFRFLLPGGEIRWIESHRSAVFDSRGSVAHIVAVARDVTERRRQEETLRARDVQLQEAQALANLGSWEWDVRTNSRRWSEQLTKIFGLRDDQVPPTFDGFYTLVHPEDRERTAKIANEALRGGVDYECQFRIVRPDGVVRTVHNQGRVDRDKSGTPVRIIGVCQDITERKRAEEDLHSYAERLKITSRRLVEVQEGERRLLARELHDRVGQNLTALGINLSIVANGLPAGSKPELAARLEECNSLLEGTVDAMRNVMAELRPHALDDYGLPAALRSLATGFSRRTGIQVAFEGDAPGADLPKPVDLAMFRIAQEALNNVAKHSNAQRVEIAIRRTNGRATLSVRDNGIGFDPERIERPSPDAAGWGLLIMRERAEAVGAQFSLKAGLDAGVQVLVEYHV